MGSKANLPDIAVTLDNPLLGIDFNPSPITITPVTKKRISVLQPHVPEEDLKNVISSRDLSTIMNGESLFTKDKGGIKGKILEDGKGTQYKYYISIIDTLQKYNFQKASERTAKRISGKRADGISSMDTRKYARRFKSYFDAKIV